MTDKESRGGGGGVTFVDALYIAHFGLPKTRNARCLDTIQLTVLQSNLMSFI